MRESANLTIFDNHVLDHGEEGIRISSNSKTGIVVSDNLVEDNGASGIAVVETSAAMVMQNISRKNRILGIEINTNSTAEIIGNVTSRNGTQGIGVLEDSIATIEENIVNYNDRAGIVVFGGNGTTLIRQNQVRFNGSHGIVIDINSTVEVRNNTVVGNGSSMPPLGDSGIRVAGGSVATINGGIIKRSVGPGIRVAVSPFDPDSQAATARIGLDESAVLKIADNGGAGILVEEDGSQATIDSRNIEFGPNADGDRVGDICDVAVEVCP